MPDLDPVEYPEGSLKRQEKEAEMSRLHDELVDSPLSQQSRGSDVPEEIWRGNGGS